MKKTNNVLGDFFDLITAVINGAERAFLDLISSLVPYGTPAPAAYLTFYHSIEMLKFPVWLGWSNALVIEALGLASVSTAIRFYRNNKSHKSDKERAPFGLAVFVYGFYLVVTITLNVVLEIVAGSRSGWIIVSIALFTLLSVPAGILISIRSLYTEILQERQERKEERQADRRGYTPNLRPAFGSDVKQETLTQKDKPKLDYRPPREER